MLILLKELPVQLLRSNTGAKKVFSGHTTAELLGPYLSHSSKHPLDDYIGTQPRISFWYIRHRVRICWILGGILNTRDAPLGRHKGTLIWSGKLNLFWVYFPSLREIDGRSIDVARTVHLPCFWTLRCRWGTGSPSWRCGDRQADTDVRKIIVKCLTNTSDSFWQVIKEGDSLYIQEKIVVDLSPLVRGNLELLMLFAHCNISAHSTWYLFKPGILAGF